MPREPSPYRRVEQIDSLWSWAERLGWVKSVLITFGAGGLLTAAVAWLQKLPRWVVLGMVFVVASITVFLLISLVARLIAYIQKRIKDEISQNPLRKRVDALENQLGPRRISDDEKCKLLQLLAGVVGRVRIIAVYPDEDSSGYANDFVELFKSMGWDVWGTEKADETDTVWSKYPIGVTVEAPSAREHSLDVYEPAQRFANAIAEVGLKFHFYSSWTLPSNCFEIRIGYRGQSKYD